MGIIGIIIIWWDGNFFVRPVSAVVSSSLTDNLRGRYHKIDENKIISYYYLLKFDNNVNQTILCALTFYVRNAKEHCKPSNDNNIIKFNFFYDPKLNFSNQPKSNPSSAQDDSLGLSQFGLLGITSFGRVEGYQRPSLPTAN